MLNITAEAGIRIEHLHILRVAFAEEEERGGGGDKKCFSSRNFECGW